MNLNHKTNYTTGDQLEASAWNRLAEDVNELGAGGGAGNNVVVAETTEDVPDADKKAQVMIVSGVTEIGSPSVIELTKKSKGVNTTLMSGNNVNIEPRESTGKAKSTKGGNISFKPGDDIEFCSHHRRFGNRDEVTMKVIDGDDHPVKLQLKAANITLSTEDKDLTKEKDENTGLDTNAALYDDPNVMNINVTTGSGKGYLKVRAQAIDLRCEEHGGIALQPKGQDGQNHINKIKFEHGGGDGLEFGTFNTKKTSIFTNEYRFNKDGKILLATRQTTASDKADVTDPTTAYKYVKQSDYFYDIIYEGEPGQEFYNYDPTTPANDTSVTWGDLVKLVAWAKTNNHGPWAS